MTALLLPSRGCTSPPQGAYTINRGSPLAQGLISTVLPAVGATAEGVKFNKSPARVSTKMGPLGPVLTCNSFDNDGGSVVNFPGNWAPHPPYTATSVLYVTQLGAAADIFVGSSYAINNGGWGFKMSPSGVITAYVTRSGAGLGSSATHGTSLVAGGVYVLTLVVQPTTFDLYVNGVLSVGGTAHTAVGLPGYSGQPFGSGGTYYGAPSANYNMSVWNRCLSPSEVLAFAKSPWQIFQQPSPYIDIQPRQYWTPAVSKLLGSGTGTVNNSIRSVMPGAVLTSQPQGAVSIDWANLITRGLIASYIPSSSLDAAANLPLIPTGSPAKSSAKLFTNGSSSYVSRIPAAKAWANSQTILTVFTPLAAGTGSLSAATAFSSGAWRGGSSIGVNSSGLLAYSAMSNNGNNFISGGSSVIGVRTIAVGTKLTGSTGPMRLFLNGVILASGTTRGDAAWGGAAWEFAIGRGPGNDINGGTTYANAATELSLVWNRVLSDAEIKSISANPWQICKAPQRYLNNPVKSIVVPKPAVAPLALRGSTRTSQPQGAVGIDWGNPITYGLVNHFNSVTGISRSKITTGVTKLTPRAKGIILSPQSTESGYSSPQPGEAVTFLAVIERNFQSFSDTQGDPIFRYGSNSFGSAFGTGLVCDGYANGLALKFFLRQASGAGELAIVDTVTASSGSKLQIVIGRYKKSSVFDLTINGVLTVGTPTANGVDTTFYNRIYTGGNNNTQSKGGTYLAAAWKRALSDAEIKSISANPWQIFLPNPRSLMVPYL